MKVTNNDIADTNTTFLSFGIFIMLANVLYYETDDLTMLTI